MISKRVLSDIRALHIDKHRKDKQLFIAEGEKVVAELLNSDLKVELVAATDKFSPDLPNNRSGVEFYRVSDGELLKISLLRTPNKVLAVAVIPEPEPLDFSEEKGLVLLLDGINDPGNMGTLIRTADWFGIRHILCSNDCVDAYNPKVVQSAMGSLFRTQIHYADLSKVIAEAKSIGGYRVIGAAADGVPFRECIATGPVMLVIGSESHGIRKEILPLLDIRTGIPKASGSAAESLNAGIAGAILLAHFHSIVK